MQGLIKNFHAESAEKISIKVCSKIFQQGLVEKPENPLTRTTGSVSVLMQMRLTFGEQSLLKIFQSKSAQKISSKV